MKQVIIIILSFVLISSTCYKREAECVDGTHNGLTVFNKSSRRINFEIYWNYPDTSVGTDNPKGFGVIETNKSRTRGAGPTSCWESVLKDGQKEYLYIFDEDSLQAIPWQTVRTTNRGLLERREISLDYLLNTNFIVVYQ